jgi:steroid 5-alpha reductase family enzyme
MTLGVIIPILALFFVLVMGAAWTVALRSGRSGWADTFWSFGVGVGGVLAALTPLAPGEPSSRMTILAAVVAIWSIRLGTHIARRTIRGGDDPRYAELRRQWGANYKLQLRRRCRNRHCGCGDGR